MAGEKFPYLARQINGKVAESFGKGFDSVYEKDAEFLEWLSEFSLDNISGEWLDILGRVLGTPRPYVVIPTVAEAFTFDTFPRRLDGRAHGFSTDRSMEVDGEQATRNDGGLLVSDVKDDYDAPLSDREYRRFLKAFCMLKNNMSLMNIGDVVSAIVGDDRYAIVFQQNVINANFGNVFVMIPGDYLTYMESLQRAFDSVFTASPRIFVEIDLDFDTNYPV